jgi:Chromo (CHRromatin Organisation MOdifier) domain
VRKFAGGDTVQITKKQTVINKTYLPHCGEMSAVQYTNQITYKIKDMTNEHIQGTFYIQELRKSHQHIVRIEKVLKTKGNKMLVKWQGYPDSFNSWIDKSDVVSLK